MKIDIISDIHLEFGDLYLPGGDLLILAGDLGEVRSFFRNDGGEVRRKAKAMHRFMDVELSKYKRVIWVPGNHEYYGKSVLETELLINMHWGNKLTFLQNNSVEIDGINFFGATMWTDLGKNNPMVFQLVKYSMNDYEMIEDFTPQTSYDTHMNHRLGLLNFLNSNRDKKVFVITHHAPCILSIPDEYKDDRLNEAYYSDLTDIMLDNENITHWVHGHCHGQKTYEMGKTTVINNARGYFGHEKSSLEYKPVRLEI